MTAEEVLIEFAGFKASLINARKDFELKADAVVFKTQMADEIHSLELLFEDFKKLKEEMVTLKTQSSIKMRVAGSVPDNMTPFASRLPPVQPASNGGNK